MAKGIVQLFCVSILNFLPQETRQKHEAEELASGDCICAWLASLQFLATFKQSEDIDTLTEKHFQIHCSLKKTWNKQSSSFNLSCVVIIQDSKYSYSLLHLNSSR